MFSYESYINLIQQLDELVALFEQHPDPITRERVTSLLSGLDLLHREGLKRLVDALCQAGAEVALHQAAEDPVVEILFGLYDLVELDLPQDPPVPASGFVPLEEITVNRSPASDNSRSPIHLDFNSNG